MISASKIFKSSPIKFNFANIRVFMGKLSGSFFIIIAIMPFAGLLLGLGSLLNTFPSTQSASAIFSDLGGALFSNLGLFFAIAIIVGFNKDVFAGVSVVWAYLLFLVYQQFILSAQNPNLSSVDPNTGYIHVLFYDKLQMAALASNLGINSLNTGVVGGLVLGAATHLTFNAFKDCKLPAMLSFFEGKRIVPLIMIPVAVFVSLLFLIVWPLISIAFTWIGTASAQLPAGLDSGIVFFIWGTLMPFGIHHAFYTIFWWTAAGGSLSMNYWFHWNWGGHDQWITVKNYLVAIGSNSPIASVVGDSNLWFFFSKNHINLNTQFYMNGDTSGNVSGLVSGINPGRFLNGNFPYLIGGYLGAGVAMYKMAAKENKDQVLALVASAVGTAMLIGVSEPVVFIFLFVAPIMYFGFQNIMNFFTAMLMNAVHVHVGTAFSCGVLDLVIYGIMQQSLGTHWWWVPLFAAICFPIYYCSFKLYMRKTGKLFPVIDSAVGALQSKDAFRSQVQIDTKYIATLTHGLGGKKNIEKIDNCATRLRLVLKDASVIDDTIIKSTGSIGIIRAGNQNIQVVYGPKAQKIAQHLKEFIESNHPEHVEHHVSKDSSVVSHDGTAAIATKKVVAKKTTSTKKNKR